MSYHTQTFGYHCRHDSLPQVRGSLPADQIDSHIEDAQKRICEFLDLDRSALRSHSSLDLAKYTNELVPPSIFLVNENLKLEVHG
jgi:hypothetical protein